MAKTIQQLLGGVRQLRPKETIKNGLPKFLPPAFFTPTSRVVGNRAEYYKTTGQRENARINKYGSAARNVDRKGMKKETTTMLHTFESMEHDPMILQNLMRLDNPVLQDLAADEVARQNLWFRTRFDNLRVSAVNSALAKGAIYADVDGAIQASSGSADTTLDFSVPAGNRNGVGGIIGAWQTSSTDILAQIEALKAKAVQTTGFELKHMFYGKNVPGYILKNDVTKNLILGDNQLSREAWASGIVPNGFCGLEWHANNLSYGLDKDGAIINWFDANQITATPEPSEEWYEFIEGSFVITKDLGGIHADAEAALKQMSQVFGQFSYAKVKDDPPRILHFAGDTFQPLITNGDAVYILDVTTAL